MAINIAMGTKPMRLTGYAAFAALLVSTSLTSITGAYAQFAPAPQAANPLAGCSCTQVSASQARGEVVAASGMALAMGGNGAGTLRPGTPVGVGSRLFTGTTGQVAVRFPAGCAVQVGPNADIDVSVVSGKLCVRTAGGAAKLPGAAQAFEGGGLVETQAQGAGGGAGGGGGLGGGGQDGGGGLAGLLGGPAGIAAGGGLLAVGVITAIGVNRVENASNTPVQVSP